MKKSLFTAIAVIAFSGVTMANTISNEEVVVNDNIVIEETTSNYPCTEDWSADMSLYQRWGFSFEEALTFADESFEICLDYEYGRD